MFCQLLYLRRCIPGRIRHALNELPETLDDTYAHTLGEIDKQNWKFAHRLFQCVAAASRPLHVNELAEFLAFNFEAGSTPIFLADWRPEDPAHTVLSICSSLLAVVRQGNGSPVVQFAHFSVKEYLTSARLVEAKDTVSRFHVSMTAAHTIVAQACLGVLLHLDETVSKDTLENFPLAEYAAEHWVGHARIEDVSSKVEDAMKRLFNPRKSYLSIWNWIYDLEAPFRRFTRSKRPEKARATPLNYAAFCGMHKVAKFLIVEHSQDVNALGFGKDTPLHVALRLGHVDVALLLLEHGADANAQSDFNLTPLLLASRAGHVEVARVLLKQGADTETQDDEYEKVTPLLLASRDGRVEFARVLLEHGADMEAQDDDKLTPLLLASRNGHVEVARVLLEHGADTEAQDYDKRTALLLASRVGHVEVARVLLEHGANTEARGEDDYSALELASISEDVEVAQVLLKHGADVKAQDGRDFTPLHLAGGEEVARLLLKHGADANAVKIGGQTPMHHLSSLGHLGAARVLLEHGVDANARDAKNATPLHLAAYHPSSFNPRGHPDVVRLLLQYGADVHAQDDEGQTPFMRATEEGNHDIMQLLLEHGAEDHRSVGHDSD